MYGTRGLNWRPDHGNEYFPDPFCDYASTVMPATMLDAHRWCEFIMGNNGVYRSAIKRVLSYFITEVKVGDGDTGDDERDKYTEFLNDVLQVKKILHDFGMDYVTYGNAFASLVVPFRRFLYCPNCSAEHPLRVVATHAPFNFQWRNYEFVASCQGTKTDGSRCGYRGAWRRLDRRSTDESEVRVKLWSPKEIDIRYEEVYEDRRYVWKIPETYKQKLREGHLHYLERANWEIVECVRDNRNLEFDPGVIFHLFDRPLSGHATGGWGISPILANFRQAWYVQVLHRYNQAIAMDYVIPFRVITPDNGRASPGEAADPVLGINVGGFMGRVRAMIRERRRNPTAWHTLPHPIKYQALGGEAKQLAPYELLDQGVSLLLDSIGVPADMYKGSLSVQAVAPALRLFESQWTNLVDGFNLFLTKLCEQIADVLGWEPVKVALVSPTVIDDVQDQMAKLQLMIGKQISQTTGLQALGMDFEDEQRRILREERYVQEQAAKIQREMDQAASMEQMAPPVQPAGPPAPGQPGQPAGPGQPAPGGAPAGPGQPGAGAAQGFAVNTPNAPNGSTTPEDMMAEAQTLAQQLLQMPESQRQSEMTKLKQQDPALHALVKQTINDIRQDAQTAGGAQLLQQQYGGG